MPYEVSKLDNRFRCFVMLVVRNRRDGLYSDAEAYYRRAECFVYLLAKVEFVCSVNHILSDLQI